MRSTDLDSATFERMRRFVFKEILDEDPVTHDITLLGTLPSTSDDGDVPAIVRLKKTPFSDGFGKGFSESLQKTEVIGSNDIYSWMLGWFRDDRSADFKIELIAPATEVHIRKYSKQPSIVIRETRELYTQVVKPYIDSFPSSRIQWVYNILSHKTESSKILHEDPSPLTGYIILPDLKWDGKSLNSLYLIAIAHSKDLRSLRDLRGGHLDMLKSIRREALRVVREKWGLDGGKLRFFVHYQPSYYQLHVHMVTVDYASYDGADVGKAHLLDHIISLLEIDSNIFEKMTLTYTLGERHGLFEEMKRRQGDLGL